MFNVTLEDGTIVEVEKYFEGDDIVLKDEAGNRYQAAQFGAHVVELEAGETPTKETETDTEPTEEEATEPAEEGEDEDGAQGGANDEAIG